MGVEKKQTEDDTQNAAREVSRRDFISISLVICVIILYYVEELVVGSEHTLKGPWVFLWAERTFAGFFTFEFLMRWREREWHVRYLLSPIAIIDLLAIVPFYVGFFISGQSLHLIRTLRLLRTLKLIPYMPGVRLLVEAIVRAWPQIRTILAIQIIVTMFSTAAIYECERNLPNTKFTSLFDSIWFTAVTVTTVGYGDITPNSMTGRLIALMTFVTGLVLFGVFAGMIGGSVTEVLEENRHKKKQ